MMKLMMMMLVWLLNKCTFVKHKHEQLKRITNRSNVIRHTHKRSQHAHKQTRTSTYTHAHMHTQEAANIQARALTHTHTCTNIWERVCMTQAYPHTTIRTHNHAEVWRFGSEKHLLVSVKQHELKYYKEQISKIAKTYTRVAKITLTNCFLKNAPLPRGSSWIRRGPLGGPMSAPGSCQLS